MRTVAALLLLLPMLPLQAAEFSGYVTLTTDYVRRGVSQSDSDSAAQLGLDLSFDNGLYMGAWGSTIDITTRADRHRDVEVNYYLGYATDIAQRWNIGANVVAYSYPGDEGGFDYDYEEYALTANYNDRLWFEVAYAPELYGVDWESWNYEVYVEQTIWTNWDLGAGLGYTDIDTLFGENYTYWQAGLSRTIQRFRFDLRYHDTDQWVPLVSTPDRAESRLVFSVSFSF